MRLDDSTGPHSHPQNIRLGGNVFGSDDSIHVLKETGGGIEREETSLTEESLTLQKVAFISHWHDQVLVSFGQLCSYVYT